MRLYETKNQFVSVSRLWLVTACILIIEWINWKSIPIWKPHSFRDHHHFERRPWQLQEELSKTHQQIRFLYVCCSVRYHWLDREKGSCVLYPNNGIAYPMSGQPVQPLFCEKYTNVKVLLEDGWGIHTKH